VAGLLAVWTWQGLEYRGQVRAHKREHDRYVGTLLAATEGALYRECRGGHYEPESLVATMEVVRERIGATGIAILAGDGRAIAEAGTIGGPTDPATRFSRAFDPPRPRRLGRGGRRADGAVVRLPEGRLDLVLRFPPDELNAALSDDLSRMAITGGALTAVVVLIVLLYGLKARALALRERLTASREQVRALDYLGRLGAGLVHETKNPLGTVRGFAERLTQGDLEPADRDRAARAILDETDRAVSRLDEFLLLSRPSELRRTAVRLPDLLGEIAELLEPDLAAKEATLDLSGVTTTVRADTEQLRRLLMNLLLNAVQAIGTGGRVAVVESDAAEGGRGAPRDSLRTVRHGSGGRHGAGPFDRPADRARPRLRPRLRAAAGRRLALCAHGAPIMTLRDRNILVVDDDRAHREMLATVLGDLVGEVRTAESGEDAIDSVAGATPDLVLLDMRMPGLSGIETLDRLRASGFAGPTVILTAYADVDDAVEAMKLGAADYLRKPIDLGTLTDLVRRHLGTAPEDVGVAGHPALPDGVVFASPMMETLLAELARAAASRVPILLAGETGTGKEILADLVHRWSPRADGPMVGMNMAALPETLIESELFGHRKGTFTGADRDREGRIRDADGGTLFLDEIGELDPAIQPKLLRVLETGRVTQLGATGETSVDFRLVTATNRDLETEIAEGRFREDLYYRIAVITIEVPPLRERREEILPLARRFLADTDATGKRLAASAEDALTAHDWPGNIRELRNAIQRAAVLAPGEVILPENLPPTVRPASPDDRRAPDESLADLEKRTILATLERCEGNRSEAARRLGISRRKLLYRLKEWGKGHGN
jgi:DNA-binding NtrC family response regulator/signal transduction histidine kinase